MNNGGCADGYQRYNVDQPRIMASRQALTRWRAGAHHSLHRAARSNNNARTHHRAARGTSAQISQQRDLLAAKACGRSETAADEGLRRAEEILISAVVAAMAHVRAVWCWRDVFRIKAGKPWRVKISARAA